MTRTRRINCLSVAFVVCNAPHFADFIIENCTVARSRSGRVKRCLRDSSA